MSAIRHSVDDSLVAVDKGSHVALVEVDGKGGEQVDCGVVTLTGHSGVIYEVTLSPDEQWVVSASGDNTAKVWSVKDKKCVRTLMHERPVSSVRVSPDGLRVVTGSEDGSVRVWEMHSGKCTLTLTGHTNVVCSVDFSPNGLKLVSGSGDRTVRVWDSQSGECLLILKEHTDVVRGVRFSPDGTKILSGSSDHTMKLWDSQTGKCEITFQGHSKDVLCVAFSFDRQTVLSGSWDKTIKIWSVVSGKCLKTLSGHSSLVRSAVFSFDGRHVISGSSDKTVKVWNVLTGECERTLKEHTDYVCSVAVSRDGTTIYSGSGDRTIKVWTRFEGTIRTQFAVPSRVDTIEFSSDGNTLIVHCADKTVHRWSIAQFVKTVYQRAFEAAIERGSVEPRTIKLLCLGAVLAGKTALLCALRGQTLPTEADRSVATRLERVRMVLDGATGVFEAVPQEEHRLASLIGGRKAEEDEQQTTPSTTTTTTTTTTTAQQTSQPAAQAVGPTATSVLQWFKRLLSPSSTTTSPSSSPSSPCPSTPSPAAPTPSSVTMLAVHTLLESELREGHIDLETFDFAGEEMFDSLPALFMGSESAYLLVFDLSVMDDPVKAQRQYEHLSKWAHIIAHQVPSTDDSYFRVLIVGTHVDTFPNNTVPVDLLAAVSDRVFHLVGLQLGDHLMQPADSALPFFQVGSSKKVGFSALTQALHVAPRRRKLPMEYVCAQDLLGRAARLNEIPLLSSVEHLDTLQLSTEPPVMLTDLMPDGAKVRAELVPYLESAADIVVCRQDATAQSLDEKDTIVFDIPRLISAVELLCSVVMARWERAGSARAKEMLTKVTQAGRSVDVKRTERLLVSLDESKTRSEAGFCREVAEWLVWTAAKTKSSGDPVLAGADVTDVSAFMACLEHLSLVHAHHDHLFIPMLLPESAPFVANAPPAPAVLFLYQMTHNADTGKWEELPVSLATFHLVVVALWRACPLDIHIEATQRCTNALTMDRCESVRLRLNSNESFIRVEMLGEKAIKCERTWTRLVETVCESTRSLRWGWRGRAVVVPAHPFALAVGETHPLHPLFAPKSVAERPEDYRDAEVVNAELKRFDGQKRMCNLKLKRWWCKQEAMGIYSHASVLIVGVSRYASSGNAALKDFDDLPEVQKSVRQLAKMWGDRGCDVETVVDWKKGDAVRRSLVVDATTRLATKAGVGAGQDSLLIVHLIGHGAEDSGGGLLLSDARETVGGSLTRLSLLSLSAILRDDVGWLGGNVLVFCDFCNSGALIVPEEDLTMAERTAPVRGYARQAITSALRDASSFTSGGVTRLTELLILALGKGKVFDEDEAYVSAVELRRRLRMLDPTNALQAALVGRIWRDWTAGMVNDGDIFLYRRSNGVASSSDC